jgi:hypothetical protein
VAGRLTNGLNPDKLDQEIKDLGVRVRVHKSTTCPNLQSLESMDHDVNCTICNNNMIDFDCFETVAIFQQQDLVEQFKVRGTFSVNEIQVTFLSGVSLQHYARVDLLDFPEEFFELVQRQEGTDTDLLKYKACKVIGLFTVNGSTKTRYEAGVHFELDVNGSIKWLGATKPDDRQIYSVYYSYLPVYRAVKAVHRDRFTQYNIRPQDIKAPKKTVGENTYVKLPETWILVRDYLIELYDPNE